MADACDSTESGSCICRASTRSRCSTHASPAHCGTGTRRTFVGCARTPGITGAYRRERCSAYSDVPCCVRFLASTRTGSVVHAALMPERHTTRPPNREDAMVLWTDDEALHTRGAHARRPTDVRVTHRRTAGSHGGVATCHPSAEMQVHVGAFDVNLHLGEGWRARSPVVVPHKPP